MYPTLKEGDLIIYKPFKIFENELSEGLLVVVKHPLRKKTLIVKRISKIYSESYERDSDFFKFLRSHDVYRESLKEGTTLLMDAESKFFKYLK